MLTRNQISIYTNLYCDRLCLDLNKDDFLYYDKDGFELNRAEQKYYSIMGFKLENCLNHMAFQRPWYTSSDSTLLIDHSLILYRCGYRGDAHKQLCALKSNFPKTSLLLNTRPKWGYDFALDSIDQHGNIFEVLHIEYDTINYDEFVQELNNVQLQIDNIDWHSASKNILEHREDWQYLRGFAQNDWKARYLLNWQRAEYTEKTI